jgi:thymidylate kinase
MKKTELYKVRQLLDKFSSDILYVHWKSNQHFDDALTGVDDLDILVDRHQYAEVVNILNELKFKRFIIPSARAYVGIEDWLGFDEKTGTIFHLHLHSQLMIGEKHLKGIHLPLEERILENRRWDEEHGAYLSSYYDELLLLMMRVAIKVRKRNLITGHVLGGSTQTEYEWLRERCPDFYERIQSEEWLTERIIKDLLNLHTKGFTWWRCNALKWHIYKDLAPYSQGSGMHNTLTRNYRELSRVVLEIKKRYLRSKYTLTRRRVATGGVTIAFLGSDGAGKSSTIKEIYKWLYQLMDVRFFYLGSGDGQVSLLRFPVKLAMKIAIKLGVVNKSNNFSDSKLQKKENSKKGLARNVWVYTLAKERIKKLTHANRCRLRGFVILTDRYPQSEFPGLCDGKRLLGDRGLAARTEEESFRIAQLCPPDLVIKMIVPPEVAAQRKPGEIDVETSRNLTERVKEIKFSKRTKCVEIDSNQPQEKVWNDVKKIIWDNL